MWYQNIILFNQNKFILNQIYLHDTKIYSYSNKIDFYSIKYIYMISKYIFIQSINFYLIKFICMISRYIFIQSNLYSKRNIFVFLLFFYPIKIYFYYMNFSFDTFLVTMSGLSFLFAKVRILLSVYKSTMS